VIPLDGEPGVPGLAVGDPAGPLDGVDDEEGCLPLDGDEDEGCLPLDGEDEEGCLPLDGDEDEGCLPLDGEGEGVEFAASAKLYAACL